MRPQSVTFVSTLVTFAIIFGGYAAYLMSTNQASAFMLDATENRLLVIPDAAWPTLIKGGFPGLSLVMGLIVAHTVVFSLITLAIGVVAGRAFFPLAKTTYQRAKPSNDRLRFDDTEFRITVKAPDSIDPTSGKNRPGQVIDTLFDDTQLRVRRSSLTPKRPPSDELEVLELALLQILHAHKDWTCDPAGHHSTVGMFEHSQNVAQRMKENTSHKLARVIGLAHDIGKLLAYEYTDGKWQIKSKRHDRLSGEIVRHLPEFHAMPEADRRTIARVLSYAHTTNLPRTLSEEARALIHALKIADGLSTSDDKKTSQKALETDSIQQIVREIVSKTIPDLNVNNYQGREHADGWTVEGVEYVAVLESKLRTRVAEQLPNRVAQSLQAFVSIESTSDHPMTKALVRAMSDLGLLMDAIGTGDSEVASYQGLFDIKVGRQKFVDVLLLDKEKFVEGYKVDLRRWASAGYRLRIIRSRRAKRSEEA